MKTKGFKMLQNIAVLIFIVMFFTGCIEQPGGGSSQKAPPSDSIDNTQPINNISDPVADPVDPMAGLKAYDRDTFQDHRNFQSPIKSVKMDYELCGALADWNPGDDRVLYLQTTTSGWQLYIENGPFNYFFSIRTSDGQHNEQFWTNHSCDSGSMDVNWVLNSNQCQIVIKNWCSNYYAPQINYMDFQVRWYHTQADFGNSGTYTVLREFN